jgi:outer membrane autotransporter protein
VQVRLGWRFAPNLRFDVAVAWSSILANDVAGAAGGNFTGDRRILASGVSGSYRWQGFVLEPSARVYALWEHENAFTDSLGAPQADRDFSTGRASGGIKASYPSAWSSSVNLAPYAGLYGDYYFSRDDANTIGLSTVPLLQGFSARLAGGLAATFRGGAQLSAGGEYGGIGSADSIWTWRARGSIPF